MKILFLLFAIMPIVEIALLVQVGGMIGGWNTIAIVIITAALGAFLVKREGLQTLQTAQLKMQRQEMPARELTEGLLLLVAGVLLVTPGFVTDAVGFFLVLPPSRGWLASQLSGKLLMKVVTPSPYQTQGQWQQPTRGNDDIIEGEFTDQTANDPKNRLD